MKHLSRQEKAFRTNPERLRHMVQKRLEIWADKEEIHIETSVRTGIDRAEVLFPNLPFKNEDCVTFVHLLNPKGNVSSFDVFLTCRKGFIVSGALAEMLARQASVSIDHLLEEKNWFSADVS